MRYGEDRHTDHVDVEDQENVSHGDGGVCQHQAFGIPAIEAVPADDEDQYGRYKGDGDLGGAHVGYLGPCEVGRAGKELVPVQRGITAEQEEDDEKQCYYNGALGRSHISLQRE